MNRTSAPSSLSGKQLVDTILNALTEALAEAVTTLDLRKQHGASDWFIVCQADNNVHTRACADRVLDLCADHHTKPWQKEGVEDGRWILLDFSDVVVHIMLPEVREYYQLEKLWGAGKKE